MIESYTIDEVGLYLCKIQMGVSYSKHTLTEAHILVVELKSGDTTGWGEVFCPDENLLWDWAVRIAPLLAGKDAAQLDTLLDAFPGDRPKMDPKICSVYCHPDVDPVAESFSIALHDLVARKNGVSFGALLGSVRRREASGMPVVTLAAPAAMAAVAKSWISAGVGFLKIKLQGRAKPDCEIVEAVRSSVGTNINLQVDANGSYRDLKDALPLIEVLNRHKVDVIEDLFDVGELEFCRAARQRLNGTYMVDKDAHWPHVREVIGSEAAGLINQHPHNQGRMSYALRIAEAARQKKIETAIGSSGFLGIQTAAFQHLSSVIGLSRPCEDIGLMNYYDGPVGNSFNFDHPPSLLKNPIRLANGKIRISDSPGLGVEVDRNVLDRLTVRTKTSTL